MLVPYAILFYSFFLLDDNLKKMIHITLQAGMFIPILD